MAAKMAKQSYIVRVSNQAEFDEVLALAAKLGYFSLLEWCNIKTVKTLFLNGQDEDVQWSHRHITEYLNNKEYSEISIRNLSSLASQVDM